MLVTDLVNVRYLSGFTGSNGALLVFADDRDAVLATDGRYRTQAAEQAPTLEIAIERALGRHLAGRAADGGVRKLGFESNVVTVDGFDALNNELDERKSGPEASTKLVRAAGTVEALREIKDAGEVGLIQAATELADAAMRGLLEAGLSGRTERELAIDLELRMRRLGAEAASFPTIVAAGAHGALPHAQPRAVEVPRGALVTIDWGAVLDGYCSDCTRTYATADPTARQREIYGLVLEAQERSLKAVRAGPSGVDIDAVARTVIEDAGHGEHFGHGLGHGVGIEVHEGPRLSRLRSEAPLRAGNVVTIEPGVYVPGELGVRIEDLAVVTDTGTRVLTSLPKQLTVID